MAILTPDYSSLDQEKMASLIGLKVKHIPLLINSFLEESTKIISKLELAIESADYETIRLNAHSLKGSSANLKFDDIFNMALSMEMASKENDVNFDYIGYLKAIKDAISTIPC